LPWPEIDGEPFQPKTAGGLASSAEEIATVTDRATAGPSLVNRSCPGPFRTPGMLAVT
jgi:hypothetical protein